MKGTVSKTKGSVLFRLDHVSAKDSVGGACCRCSGGFSRLQGRQTQSEKLQIQRNKSLDPKPESVRIPKGTPKVWKPFISKKSVLNCFRALFRVSRIS